MEATSALAAALDYLHAGLSVIPIRPDGTKASAIHWDDYKTIAATDAQARYWWANPALGIAIIGGQVSGNLGILDIEFPDFTQLWCELVEVQEPGLISNLPRVTTPGKTNQPGSHFYFRAPHPLATGKLARLTPLEAEARTGDKGKVTAIELKAEGGYVLAPGCPSTCHPSGRLYQHVGGPFIEEVPTLTNEQVELLLSCARAIDRCPQAKGEPYVGSTTVPNGMARPGDVFNQKADWKDVLEPHGWVLVKDHGVRYWRRPGKEKGISATTGYCRSEKSGDLMCVFSSNADPLTIQPGKDHQCFSKFAAFAILGYGGDFLKAAKHLAQQGYGFDYGMSEAQQLAQKLAALVKEVADDSAWDRILHNLKTANLEHNWGLSEYDMKSLTDEAKKHRIEHDPKLLAARVKREINESIATPDPPPGEKGREPPWQLVIIKSEPPEYLLRSPFWSQRPSVQATGGFIRLQIKQLATWALIRHAAIEQAETSPPAKMFGWDDLLSHLLDHAKRQETIMETRRPMLVAEFIHRCLVIANEARDDEEGERRLQFSGQPQKIGGIIAVKAAWLVERAATGPDGITRKEIMTAMQKHGMKAAQLGSSATRSRWWTIGESEMESLSKEVLG